MLGFLLGAAFGGAQLVLLLLAVNSVSRGKLKIWALVGQYLCPVAGLLLCAVTISSLLIIGAVVKFISARKGKKG